MKTPRMSRQRAEYLGQWLMERFTICRVCDRYVPTTYDRWCHKCWIKARKNVIHFIAGWLS